MPPLPHSLRVSEMKVTKIVNEAMWLIRLLVSLAVLVILLGATEYMGDTYRWVLPAAHLITR